MTSGPRRSQPESSAAGERRALTGLLPQYRAAATAILAALHLRELEFVEITHDSNGAVDDFVIGSSQAVHAYQVKWREYAGAFTFRQLTSADKDGRTLIGDLVDGHRLLSKRFPSKRVVVHLYTCDYPSNNDNCRAVGQPTLSFAKFLDQVWKPAQVGDLSGAQTEEHAWRTVLEACAMTQEQFLDFVPDCSLDFGVQVGGEISGPWRDKHFEADQIRELAQLLMDLAIDPCRPHHFDRSTLLERLNWSHFFRLRNRHEFSVTPAYQDIQGPRQTLEAALNSLAGGYIFVGGSPGSGKSSLLTRTFEARAPKERWVRYYAFVPGSPEPGGTRGESENFLHDLTLALEGAGVVAGHSRSTFDRQQLLQRLDEQLQILGQHFANRGTRTVLLIDGLDHIPREQHPEVSMLKDLPLPDRVPDGVYILLGSQTDQLKDIPPAVRVAIAHDTRRVMMEPLSPSDVDQVIDRSELAIALTDGQREAVFKLSQGHPLALGLLLNDLRDATEPAAADAVLAATEPYVGDIDNVYQAYWQSIAENENLVYLLALITRLRRHIDIGWLHSFANHADLNTLKTQLQHLFYREADDRWFFFHNSFRLFLHHKTATLVAGSPEDNDRELHRILADHCANSDPGSLWCWETLYHLVEAGRHQSVVDLATPQYFRQQVRELRPLDAVAGDIRHALQSAKTLSNVTAIVRLVLAAAECTQRGNGISSQEVAAVLLRLGEVHLAIEHLFDGRDLRVSNDAALRCSRILLDIERETQAQRLFELGGPPAGPLDSEGHDAAAARESLVEWVKAASAFRPVEKILTFIHGVNAEPGHFHNISAEQATQSLRADLLFHLSLSLRGDGRDADASRVEGELDTEGLRKGWWFWLQVQQWRACQREGDKDTASALLRNTLQRIPLADMDDAQRGLVAEGLFLAEGRSDLFETVVAATKHPAPITEYLTGEHVMGEFRERFRITRLYRAIGRDDDPTDLVPNAQEFEGEGSVYFERAIIRIASVWGDAWRGRRYSEADVRQAAGDLLRFFDRGQRQRIRWRSWHSFTSSREEFYSLLINAVSEHGIDALMALRSMFEAEWSSPDRRWLWPASLCRAIALEFYVLGSQRTWALGHIRSLEAWMLDGHDISGRVQECKDQAEAYGRLRDNEKGLEWLRRMLDTAFGVGYRKDYQLEHWMEWLPQINRIDPAGAPARFSWFAAAARKLDGATEGRSARTAAKKLITHAAKWSPRRAAQLLLWFRDNGPVWYGECVLALMEVFADSRSLSRPVFLAAMRDFVPRFLKQSSSDLSRKFVLEMKRLHSGNVAEADATDVYGAINVLALQSTRSGWVAGLLDGLSTIGTTPLPVMPVPTSRERDSGSSALERSVTLKDGIVLKGEELRNRTSTVDGLITVIEQIDETAHTYMSWRDSFDALASNASAADVKRLAAVATTLRDEPISLAKLSLRLSALGDHATAWDIGISALEMSREYGWTRWADGASRVQALTALIAADAERGRSLAIETFSDDMIKRHSYPGEVVQNLIEIVPLMVDPYPVREIWAELQDYLQALCPGMESQLQPALAEAMGDDTPDRAMIDLLLGHLAWPVTLLGFGSQHALGSLLEAAHTGTIAGVGQLLTSDDDEGVLAALSVVEACGERDQAVIRAFEQDLERLCLHPSFAVWYCARGLLSKLGHDEFSPRPSQALPAVYTLALPPQAEEAPYRPDELLNGGVLRDPLDYLDVLKPFDSDMRWVARLLDRPAIQMLHRARSIMGEMHDPNEWSARAEERLQGMLSDAGLEFTFRRPRATIARIAMYRAISELFDAGEIDNEAAQYIYEAIRPCDPDLTLRRANPRPVEISPIEGLTEYGNAESQWVEALTQSHSRHATRIGDNLAIGEITTLKRLAWEQPTIHVESSCVTRPPVPDSEWWPRYTRTSVKEYPGLVRNGDTEHLVVHKEYDGRDNDCSRWIGLNPAVGRILGWMPSQLGFLRWVDSDEQTMAETVWWKDGSLDHRPPEFEDEVGEGWLVVVSDVGWDAIKKRFPRIFRLTETVRELRPEGQELRKTSRTVQEVDTVG